MQKNYRAQAIEKKWQKEWEQSGTYRQYARKQQFYVLDMFPYPSGAGLHVGHPRGYIATDVIARFKQLSGYGVLHPMGWDAFGLPAEQYALKNKVHPEKAVKENVAMFKRQLAKLGLTYDWEREINTTDPEYYRWTQWIFLQMWKQGLAYESNEPINWCPSCKTGLANEDLEQGKCERCGSAVEKRPLRQWVLRMTKYADRLLKDLDSQELEWSESIKDQQRNWIGRSEGVEVVFCIADSEEELRVFTTRVDTIFGCTYVVVAPEHPLLQSIEQSISNIDEVKEYIRQAGSKSDLERTELAKEKTGVKLEGIEVVNPFTGGKVPVYVADYVLGSYGTGAVMAVPAHDTRDAEFALKYGLDIKTVILSDQTKHIEYRISNKDQAVFVDDGVLVDSGEFTGLRSKEARKKMSAWLKKEGLGEKRINYKMRDWTFSRQRYWGEPIPLVHCEKCGVVPVPEKELPVLLPKVKAYEPTDTGESPLAGIAKWVNTECPKCQGKARRETNTMPQWAGSCWYYLRFIDPKNTKTLVDKKKEAKHMPVDLYVGGTEHATRHLLYARFWHKFLFDIGVVSGQEPFKKLVNQGLINASDGRKMSKRWGNVINPDDIVADFGADAFRLYEMFMGPFAQTIAWNTDGVVGTRRFLEKVWKLGRKTISGKQSAENEKLESLLHQTIKKVTEDIEEFKFNTAISALMILVNALEKETHIPYSTFHILLILISPFAPHIAEELWQEMGEKQSIFLAGWPMWDKKKIVAETVNIAVQVNGKVRVVLTVDTGSNETEVQSQALSNEKIKALVVGKEIRKVIYVPGKILNIVVG
ncbi:MAG: leucine--tRNA ligase [Candidatus Moranbacteria bacterium]|nr:leucine--tRNA ligase [Candidatus Moranbacteria bacterium]MBP6034124.1 leucine--tRNA ligase [Candidatus Moranbacteria bacterium]MBP7695876.1 leucine--tRNA ligase [Candidatus Moranbacteria bacterium]